MEVLLNEKQLDAIITGLAEQITEDFKGQKPVFAGILKGSFLFMADLVRKCDMELDVDFMELRSYLGRQSSGEVEVRKDLSLDVKDRPVIIIEDIIDTGRTLNFIKQHILGKGASRVYICSLLAKPSRHAGSFQIDYTGHQIDDLFVVGYGMDLDERFRNLPRIHVLKNSES